MCDAAYVLMIDALERQWHTNYIAAFARSAFSEDAPQVESWAEVHDRFDRWLLDTPFVESEEQTKLRLLGLR